jgi:membrane fusion protein, multidrug efflux system
MWMNSDHIRLRVTAIVRRAVLLLLASVAIAGCKRGGGAQGAMKPPPPLVTTAAVTTQDVPLYIDEIGKCAAIEMVAIKPQASGEITKVAFEEGSDVKPGQLLFTIDRRPYEAQLAQAKAQFSQAKAQLDLAKLDFERVKDLPRSVEPQSDLDQKKNAIEVANAQVEAGQAAIETANVNLNYCTINSPIGGLAGQRMADLGNVVIGNNPMSSSGTLVTIQRMDPIYADFTVTEAQLPAVRANMAKGTLKTLVRLPSDGEGREGALTFLDNAVQDGSGTVKLRATLQNKDRHFWPGQFIFVRLVLNVQKDAVLVPNAAVQVGQQGPYVYVVDAQGNAQLRPVDQGQRQGDLVVINKGVQPGENVIVQGQMMVMPGGPVRVQQPPATAQQADADKREAIKT